MRENAKFGPNGDRDRAARCRGNLHSKIGADLRVRAAQLGNVRLGRSDPLSKLGLCKLAAFQILRERFHAHINA